MRFALIGCGHIAATAHIPALLQVREQEEIEPVACCDLSEARALAARSQGGFAAAYADWERMLARERPDAVLLALPFQVAMPVATAILTRGIPLLMEKPPGNDADETEQIARVAARSGTLHQVAFNRHHMPLIDMLQEDIADARQSIRHIDYRMYRVNRTENHFHTTAIHGIGLVGFLARAPYSRVELAYGAARAENGGGGDISMLGTFANGTTAQLSFCPMAGHVVEALSVITTGATYDVDLPVWSADGARGEIVKFEAGCEVFRRPGPAVAPEGQFVHSNGFVGQLAHFVRDVRAGRQPRDHIDTALSPMAVMDAMARKQASYTAE